MLSRRDFVHAGCAAATVTLAPHFLDVAEARAIHGAVAAPSGFNGGLGQVNFNEVQVGGAYPFLDVVKSSQAWSYYTGTKANWRLDPEDLDTNGMPTTAPDGYFGVTFIPSSAARSGNYVCRWTATGGSSTLLALGNIQGGGSASTTGAGGRYVFAPTVTRLTPGVTAMSGGYVTGIHVMHEDDEQDWLNGKIFGRKFIERLVQANFGALRFLKWQGENGTNVSTWGDEKSESLYSYAAHEWRANLMAGATSLVGSAYSASAPSAWAGLVHGAKVQIRFGQTTTSGTPTLNIGGTGNKTILNYCGGPLDASTYPVHGQYYSLATLTYDASLNGWVKHGGDAGGDFGINSGVPTSICLRLCKEVGAHPQFAAPFLAVDNLTDYIPSQAYLCKTYAEANASWMIPRFGGPNEQWNPSFLQNGYAQYKATSHGWSSGQIHDQYGKVISLMGQAIATVYGGVGNLNTKYKMLCGVQTATGAGGGSAASDARITSAQYIADGVAPSSLAGAWGTITFSAASGTAEGWRWVSNVEVAPYWSPLRRFTTQELIDGYDYTVASAGNPSAQAALVTSYANTALGASGNYNLSQNNDGFLAWQAWGSSFKASIKIHGYEGGYSPDYLRSTTSWFSTITAATKNAAGCQLTLGTACFNSEKLNDGGPGISGNPAVVGMAVVIDSVAGMTELNNPVASAVTFAGGGSANIAGANTLKLNQAVYFVTDASLPVELAKLTKLTTANFGPPVFVGSIKSLPYFVVSTGNPFQISATRGGTPLTFNSTGSAVLMQEAWFIKTVAGTGNVIVTLDVDSSGFTTYTSGGNMVYVHSQTYSNNLRWATKNSTDIANYMIVNWEAFIAAGGEFPSCFQMSGEEPPSADIWQILEDVYQEPDPPMWTAMAAFNN